MDSKIFFNSLKTWVLPHVFSL